ncbi:MAG: type II secretion system F family protein, partial [Verrucomicrobia bacterium]|nr:type II secretion system F family protein [Verrucomicrobiota bacterium]
PDFDLALIDAGEQSGRLDSCFRALMDYYNERAVIARQMIVQLIYPVILVHFAVLVFLIVLPFAGSQFHASLPFLFLKAALVLLPFYAVTVALIYAMQNKRGERWRSLIESAIAWIPVLGGARRCLALARLAMALEALLSAGVNVIEAWEIAARVSSSAALGRVVERWKTRLMAGSTPAELIQATPLFPGPFASLYASGEVSGKLDETLNRLHVYYQEEGSHKLQMLAQWVPRAIYFIVALIIAYNIIQFYTGYFRQAVNVGF